MGFKEHFTRTEKPNITGCTWQYNEDNDFLKPTQFPLYYPRYEDMSPSMQRFVQGVSKAVRPVWSFSAAAAKSDHVAVVYTNQTRCELVNNRPNISEFVEPELISQWGYILKREVVDDLLTGTNLHPVEPMAIYNALDLQNSGFLKRGKHSRAYQTGVAYILVAVGPISEAIEITKSLMPLWEWNEMAGAIHSSRAKIRILEEQIGSTPERFF